MVKKAVINALALVAYGVNIVGIACQIAKTANLKTVDDISFAEVTLRLGALVIIMWKIFYTKDKCLICGHTALTLAYTVYWIMVLCYR